MKYHLGFIGIVFLTVVVIFGCQEYGRVEIVQKNNTVVFNFDATESTENGHISYVLYSIAVNREDCPSNCVIWEMVREAKYYDTIEYPLAGHSIQYGAKQDGMRQVTRPVPLERGTYNIIANIAMLRDGIVVKTQIVSGKFDIDEQNH